MNWRKKIALSLSGLLAVAGMAVAAPAGAAPIASAHSWNACEAPNPAPPGVVTPGRIFALPFRMRDGLASLVNSNGWVTSTDEETYVGPGLHRAADLEFTRQPDHGYGLPVLAPADGRAYFSYQNLTTNWVDPQGVTHRIGVGAGLFVEVRVAGGWVMQLIHLATIDDSIKHKYLPPVPDPDVPGDWFPDKVVGWTNEQLWEFGVPVRRGQKLGTQGDTGIGLDWNDDFDVATGEVRPRDRQTLKPWDPPQLHIQVYRGRINGAKQNIIDTFDGYWQNTTKNRYTPWPGLFCMGPNHVWLTGPTGQPQYAAW